jgi:Uma2 family endonuclease
MPELMTLEQFAALPDTGERLELVRGKVRVMSPVHGPAGYVAAVIHGLLFIHVHERRLGVTFIDNMGVALLGAEHTNRSPDVAFVRADRLPPRGIGPGPIRVAPDLAVEVLSPSESASTLEDKLADYRRAGTPLIWVVDPTHRLVTVHPADAPSYSLREGDELTGGRVLPGFRCPVAELFERLAPADDA